MELRNTEWNRQTSQEEIVTAERLVICSGISDKELLDFVRRVDSLATQFFDCSNCVDLSDAAVACFLDRAKKVREIVYPMSYIERQDHPAHFLTISKGTRGQFEQLGLREELLGVHPPSHTAAKHGNMSVLSSYLDAGDVSGLLIYAVEYRTSKEVILAIAKRYPEQLNSYTSFGSPLVFHEAERDRVFANKLTKLNPEIAEMTSNEGIRFCDSEYWSCIEEGSA